MNRKDVAQALVRLAKSLLENKGIGASGLKLTDFETTIADTAFVADTGMDGLLTIFG